MKSIATWVVLVLLCISVVAGTPQTPNTKRSGWVLRFDGIGAVRVGMTINQINAALGENFSTPTDEDEQTCFYAEPKNHPGTAIMMLDGRIARVDVVAPGIATAEGVRIGDSEARVKKVYGQKVAVSPHQYTDGHYLTIRSGKYGLRFETYENKVTTFYAGTQSAIEFVEGCN